MNFLKKLLGFKKTSAKPNSGKVAKLSEMSVNQVDEEASNLLVDVTSGRFDIDTPEDQDQNGIKDQAPKLESNDTKDQKNDPKVMITNEAKGSKGQIKIANAQAKLELLTFEDEFERFVAKNKNFKTPLKASKISANSKLKSASEIHFISSDEEEQSQIRDDDQKAPQNPIDLDDDQKGIQFPSVSEVDEKAPPSKIVPDDDQHALQNPVIPNDDQHTPKNNPIIPHDYQKGPQNLIIPDDDQHASQNPIIPDDQKAPQIIIVPDDDQLAPNPSDDEDSSGYISSDFEFITQSEAELDGLVINYNKNMKKKGDKTSTVKTVEICRIGNPRVYPRQDYENFESRNRAGLSGSNPQITTQQNNENLINFEVEDNGYAFLEGNYDPLPQNNYFLEQKSLSFNTTSRMQTEDGVGFDLYAYVHRNNVAPVDDRTKLEAESTKQMILDMYPQERPKRRRF